VCYKWPPAKTNTKPITAKQGKNVSPVRINDHEKSPRQLTEQQIYGKNKVEIVKE
jgi:hypothetical protein